MKPLVSALCILATILAGCTGGPRGSSSVPSPSEVARPAPLAVLDYKGTSCTELAFLIPVPMANVQPYVHAPYKVFTTNNMATLVVGETKCRTIQVAGATLEDAIESEVGAFINDPEGGQAPATYNFWQAANRPELAENMSRVGFTTGYAAASNLLPFSLYGAVQITGHVGWQGNTYSLNATAAPQNAAVPVQTFRWYHADENGTSKVAFTLTFTAAGAAQGDVSAYPSTWMSKLLGATSKTAEGVYWSYGLDTKASHSPK